MSKGWSLPGGVVGALLGLSIAAVVILARSPVGQLTMLPGSGGNSAISGSPSQPNTLHGMNAPSPIGGSFGGYATTLSRIADLHLELGQVDEAVETIAEAASPFEAINYLQKFRTVDSPMGGFAPAIPLAPITADSRLPPTYGPVSGVPNANWPPKEFTLKVLDRLRQRLLLPPPPTLGIVAEPTPEAAAAALAASRERAELLVAVAELYRSIDEPEQAKELLSHVDRQAIANQQTADVDRPQVAALGLGMPTSQASSHDVSTNVEPSQNHESGPWEWMFAAGATILGTVLGGVFKPVLEAYGKGVVGRALAEAIQDQEFAAALNVKLNQPSPRTREESRDYRAKAV